MPKASKDVLTISCGSGILTKLFDGDEVQKVEAKEFEKTRKKYLTKRTEPDIIVNVPLEGRVPCKLNNVRKESTSGASFSRGSRRSCG